MRKSIHIDVVVDGDEQKIVVIDDAGNARELNGIIVCGSDMVVNSFYCFAWGSAREVGYALARAYREANEGDMAEHNHPFYRDVFRSMAHWVGIYRGWVGAKEGEPADVLDRWAEEDKIAKAIKQGQVLNDPKKLH